MTAVLNTALETYRRHRFLAQATVAYETLASNPTHPDSCLPEPLPREATFGSLI
jgi:hypothetical protein